MVWLLRLLCLLPVESPYAFCSLGMELPTRRGRKFVEQRVVISNRREKLRLPFDTLRCLFLSRGSLCLLQFSFLLDYALYVSFGQGG